MAIKHQNTSFVLTLVRWPFMITCARPRYIHHLYISFKLWWEKYKCACLMPKMPKMPEVICKEAVLYPRTSYLGCVFFVWIWNCIMPNIELCTVAWPLTYAKYNCYTENCKCVRFGMLHGFLWLYTVFGNQK